MVFNLDTQQFLPSNLSSYSEKVYSCVLQFGNSSNFSFSKFKNLVAENDRYCHINYIFSVNGFNHFLLVLRFPFPVSFSFIDEIIQKCKKVDLSNTLFDFDIDYSFSLNKDLIMSCCKG